MIPAFIKDKAKNLKKRTVLEKIESFLGLPDIILLLGMRQTGKSSLLYLTVNLLQGKRIPESNIFYFSLEDPTILSSFNRNIKELEIFLNNQKVDKNFKNYILIDEIQYLKNPSNFLKYYFDNFHNYKFIVTGSSTFQIKKKFKDSLAGRKKTIQVMPLDFKEFLHFQEIDFDADFDLDNLDKTEALKIDAITKEKIQEKFKEYLVFGGHPKIPLLESAELKIQELKDIYNDYIRKDIQDIAKIENIDAYNNLIQLLASQIGNLLNTLEISNTIALNHITLKKYLFLLENSFVVSSVKPYFQNKRKELSKMPKIYLEDLGLRNAVLSDFKHLNLRSDLGSMVENFVFNELDKSKTVLAKINFWRTLSKQEVDFVYQTSDEIIPIEVKFRIFKEPKIPSGLKSFIQYYTPKKAVIVTQDFLGIHKFKKTKIYFMPACFV